MATGQHKHAKFNLWAAVCWEQSSQQNGKYSNSFNYVNSNNSFLPINSSLNLGQPEINRAGEDPMDQGGPNRTQNDSIAMNSNHMLIKNAQNANRSQIQQTHQNNLTLPPSSNLNISQILNQQIPYINNINPTLRTTLMTPQNRPLHLSHSQVPPQNTQAQQPPPQNTKTQEPAPQIPPQVTKTFKTTTRIPQHIQPVQIPHNHYTTPHYPT
jgi:hypothetical protein